MGQRHHEKSEVHWRPSSFREDPGFQTKRSTQIDAQGIGTRHMHSRMGNFRQHGGGHASARNGRGGRTDWDGILLANSYSLFYTQVKGGFLGEPSRTLWARSSFSAPCSQSTLPFPHTTLELSNV